MVMVLWGMVTWWYTVGWRQCWLRVKERLDSTLDYFSIGLLFSTLFAPFRQISAGQVKGSFDTQVQAIFDRLISRFIGCVVRLVMIGIGSLMIVLNLLTGVALLFGWLFVPLLPVIGLVLFIAGWLPWKS